MKGIKNLALLVLIAVSALENAQAREGSKGSEAMFNLLANYVRVDHAMGGKAYVGLFDGLSCDKNSCDLRSDGTIAGADAKKLRKLLALRGVAQNAQGTMTVKELICRSVFDDENGDYLYNCDILL